MTNIDDSAEYITEVQRACRLARETKERKELLKAQALVDSYRFLDLPEPAQQDLLWAYAEAAQSVTGYAR